MAVLLHRYDMEGIFVNKNLEDEKCIGFFDKRLFIESRFQKLVILNARDDK